MSQAGRLDLVETDPLTQFTGAIALNAAAYLDLLAPSSLATGRTRLRAISVISAENVGWGLWFFNTRRTGAEPSADQSQFAGLWEFTQADGFRIAGAGLYYYYVDGLDIPYETLDLLPDGRPDFTSPGYRRYLHLALVARGIAKAAATLVKVRLHLEVSLG